VGGRIIPAGDYEYKVAIDDTWTVNYGAGGAAGGSNIPISIPSGTTSVTFTWDQVTHVVTHTLNN
jgi:pullulanase